MYALLELCYTKKRKFGVMIATTLVSLCYHSWTNTLDLMRIKCSVCDVSFSVWFHQRIHFAMLYNVNA